MTSASLGGTGADVHAGNHKRIAVRTRYRWDTYLMERRVYHHRSFVTFGSFRRSERFTPRLRCLHRPNYIGGTSIPCFRAIATILSSSESSGGAGLTDGSVAGLPASSMNRSTPAGA